MIFLLGCSPVIHLYELDLSGEVVADPPAVEADGPIQLELHFASQGEGALAHPLGRFAEVTLDAPGPFSARVDVPVDDGEGVVLYGFWDLDGDGVLCALGAPEEPAGLVEVEGFPVHTATVTLTLDQPCAAPDALFP
jgi:hypothetical protein